MGINVDLAESAGMLMREMSVMQNTKPLVVLCDIDGTVADCNHRLHWIDPKINVGDWVTPRDYPQGKSYRGIVTKVATRTGPFKTETTSFEVDWKGNFPIAYRGLRKIKRWDKFFEECDKDPVLEHNAQVVRTLAKTYPVIFMSGRSIDYIGKTVAWLIKAKLDNLAWAWDQFKVPTTAIHMRPSKDTREDYIVKKELYEKHIKPYYDVLVVIDDRQQVVDMWRSIGLNCWQVAKGDF